MEERRGLDRRKFPRVNYPCLVVVKGKESGTSEVLLTHTENVGVGGICVILKRNIKMFSEVELELDLLDLNDHIRCSGKVVWSVQRQGKSDKKAYFYDHGIEFQKIPAKEKERIDKVVERLVELEKEV